MTTQPAVKEMHPPSFGGAYGSGKRIAMRGHHAACGVALCEYMSGTLG